MLDTNADNHAPAAARSQPLADHTWAAVVESPTAKLFTCTRCGLFRLETLNGAWFLHRWSPAFSQCSAYPYRDT